MRGFAAMRETVVTHPALAAMQEDFLARMLAIGRISIDPETGALVNRPRPPRPRKPFVPKREGFIYVLRLEGGDLYKIGFTRNPSSRFEALRIQGPFTTQPIYLARVKNPSRAERFLHLRFASSRMAREWFRLSAEDIAKIKYLYPDVEEIA
jgi:hypothetical protein